VSVPLVVDAAPVIVLAKTNYMALLHLASDPVLIPQAVAHEIQGRGPNDPAAQALAQTTWLVVVDPGPVVSVLYPYRLHAGEAEVLTWALAHPGTTALLDDRAARRCAAALGVPHRGILELVITARRQGAIPAARPVLEQLRQVGWYLSDPIMNLVLALVGE
jgi:predicted nucleic acid-binding protein